MSGGQEEAFELFNRAVLCHVLPVGLLLADQLIQLAEFLFLPVLFGVEQEGHLSGDHGQQHFIIIFKHPFQVQLVASPPDIRD